jgi:AcrR family transcriptional regulator
MNGIIEASGVSTGGVYYHFKTKEDIFHLLYLNTKKSIIDRIFEDVDFEESTRLFFEKYWYARVNWAFENPKEKKFLEMLYQSPYRHVRICDELAGKYRKIAGRLEAAMEVEEIINMDVMFLFTDIDASIMAVLNYLDKCQEADKDEMISFAFKKYWRSIVN